MSLKCLGNDNKKHEIAWIKGKRAYVAAITVCNSKLDPVLQATPDPIILFYAAGGLTASGETQVFVEVEPSVLVLVGGSAAQEFIYSVEFSGGGLIQGLALKTFNDTVEGEGGAFGGGTATVLLDAFTLDDFYQTNSNIIFDLTIDSNAREEFRKLPDSFLGVPDMLYDVDLNKFLSPTMVYNAPEGWKQQYKNIKLKVSYLANGVWVKNSENTVQGRSKGYGSFRPYNRQMPFKIKSSNFINGLDEVKDMTLNNMGQNQARLTEHLVYKIYNDYGMPAPRANYSRVFINDTTVKINNIQNNLITTTDSHYLVEGMRVKFASLNNISPDQTFYVTSSDLTTTTFKVSLTLNGTEFSLNDFSTADPNQYIEFFTDFGEYINVENVHNEYRLTGLFGANNTKHVYEVNVTTGPNELNASSTLAYDADYGNSNDRSDLSNFLNKLNSNENWYQNIQTCVNLNQFIKFTAIESYCGNWDGYSWFLNNTHLHSDANGVFSLIPWGVDQYFSAGDILVNYLPWSKWIHQCLSHIETLLMFRDEVLNFHNWIQNESGILNYIDNIFSQKLQDFESDKKKPSYLTSQFLTNQKDNIKYFLSTNRCNDQINTLLQRPRCPTNVQSRFDGRVITITWNAVTEDLQGNIIPADEFGNTVSYAIAASTDPDGRLAYFNLLDSVTDTSYSFDFGNILEDYAVTFYILPANNLIGFPSPACIAYPVYKSTGGAKLSGSSIVNSVSPGVIRVTEAMSNSGANGTGTGDWFELTNVGGTTINITGWKMDDNSFSYSASVPIVRFGGWTTIEPGESVICLESSNPNTDVPAFKTFWNLGSSVKVATYTGTGVGLSNTSDGVIIFNENQAEVTRVSFGSATTGVSFYWQYDIYGTLLSSGKNTNGQLGAYSVSKTFNGTLTTNVGSPGIFIA